jgi:hypothetical protein
VRVDGLLSDKESVARVGLIDVDVSKADWQKCASCRVGETDARRAEQTPFISQIVDLQGYWILTCNALSRVSPVKCLHLLNPRRLALYDRAPVGCGVQPKRLVKVRERRRPAKK